MLLVQRRVGVHGDDKYDVRANLNQDLLTEINFPPECPMTPYGNKTSIHIAENVVFYERTKHIEVDCHIVRKKLEEKNHCGKACIIRTSVSKSSYQTTWKNTSRFYL